MVKLFSSYFNKLISLNLILILIPIIIISSYLYLDKIYVQENTLKEKLISASENGANNISTWIEERKNNVHSIAKNEEVITMTKMFHEHTSTNDLFVARLNLEKKIYTVFSNYVWLDEVVISNTTGNVLFYTDMNPPEINLKDQKYFQDVLENKVGISDVFTSTEIIKNEYGNYEIGVPTLLISSPISSEIGLEGVLIARVNVFDLVTNTNLDQNHISTDTINEFLVNSHGYFISKPDYLKQAFDQNLIKKRAELELHFITPNSMEFTSIYHNSNDVGTLWNMDGYKNYLGDTVIGSVTPVKGTSWFYVVEMNKNTAYQSINQLQLMLLSSISLIITFTSALTILFANNLVNPIKKLTNIIERIDKNPAIEFPLHELEGAQNNTNEISKLYVTFNKMMSSLDKSTHDLKLAEKKFRTLYDEMPDLCRTIDTNGIILDCNKVYASSLGYSKEEVIGKSIFDHTAEKDLESITDSFQTWKKSGNVSNREIWLRRKDGTTFLTMLNATAIYDEKGNLLGSNTVIRDMTEIYKAKNEVVEQKEKRLSAIGELSARISHDLRNPLSVIKTSVSILRLRTGTSDERTQSDLVRIERAISRMTHQIDEVLDYVSPKPLNKQNTTILKILSLAMERINMPATVKINLPKEDLKLNCEPEKIEIIFVNLITNAIQSMRNIGSIFIRASLENNQAIIEVEDSGPGFRGDVLQRLFDPLFTTRQIGTGLGLVSCKRIVEQHSGTIEAKNSPDGGALFIIKIPVNV
ncbi:MAG: PAS domain S-box protein [Thaumarchaeota archaeon]|nr:PAS domain S-box protein [Nitrososphaerota archaeon]